VEIHTQEVLRWLEQSRTNAPTPFELIYADPPYAAGLYETVLKGVESGGLLRANGRIILECSSTAIPEIPAEGWQLIKQKRYGSSTVLVLEPS
jgi:16S rRNA G966 N2-methylase RsmD